MSSAFIIHEHIVQGSHIREYPHATANSQEETLVLHLKQYVPKDNQSPQKGDLTIIATQANGFPKELYEPLWEDLYAQLRSKGIGLRTIWICDAASQGVSGQLNRQSLGNDPCWFDHSRDITHIINTFRMPRPIMAVGHSFGASVMIDVALNNPRLFSSMALMEPVVEIPDRTSRERYTTPTYICARRKDQWPSREVAAKFFAKNPLYSTFDKRVLDQWTKYGLIDSPVRKQGGTEVVLATSKHQEVYTFQRPSYHAFSPDGKTLIDRAAVPDMDTEAGENAEIVPTYRPEMPFIFARLPNLRPDIQYIFGGKSYISQKPQREEKMRVTGIGRGGSGGQKNGRVTAALSVKDGHAIPFQNPGFCAEAIANCAAKSLETWRIEDQKFQEWAKKSTEEKTTISKDFTDKIKPRKGVAANTAVPASKLASKL